METEWVSSEINPVKWVTQVQLAPKGGDKWRPKAPFVSVGKFPPQGREDK